METKFYTYSQNNSGGVFKKSDKEGICEYVIIEALTAKKANKRAIEIGLYFDGCESGNDCSCCGDRWNKADERDGYNTPCIYGQDLTNVEKTVFMENCFIHYLKGDFVKAVFK